MSSYLPPSSLANRVRRSALRSFWRASDSESSFCACILVEGKPVFLQPLLGFHYILNHIGKILGSIQSLLTQLLQPGNEQRLGIQRLEISRWPDAVMWQRMIQDTPHPSPRHPSGSESPRLPRPRPSGWRNRTGDRISEWSP